MRACKEAIEFFERHYNEIADVELLKDVLQYQEEVKEEGEDIYNWCYWLIVRLLQHKERVRFAVHAAEMVLNIFEEEYPEDKRPRQAIEAAKAWLENPCEETQQAAAAWADAAYAWAAANAADAYAAYAADAADAYAADAADAAAYAAYACPDIKDKILEYGIELLKAK